MTPQVWLYQWLLLVSLRVLHGLPERIRVGGLFDDSEDRTTEAAFRYAISRVNQDKTVLSGTKLQFDIQHLPSVNSFLAAKKACNQAGLGVAAVFGPRTPLLASHINSMCNTLEVPHLESRLEVRSNPSYANGYASNSLSSMERQLFSINVFPEASLMSQAILALIRHFEWKKFCIMYGDQGDLLLLQDILRAPLNSNVEITVRQAHGHNLRETLKEIGARGFHNVLAHLDIDLTKNLLKAALQVQMLDSSHHYIVTNLDLETLDLDEFSHSSANVTGFRLINRDDPRVKDVLKQMELHQRSPKNEKLLNTTRPPIIKTEAALMYDAVYVLAHGLQQVDKSTRLRLVNLSCDGDQAWAFGSSLYNYLNLVETDGLTGKITFDRGRRLDFEVDILQLTEEGPLKVGAWNTWNGPNFTRPAEMTPPAGQFGNKTLVVTTIFERPYLQLRKSEQLLTGNDQYQGFCVDLLEEIAKSVGFMYEIKIVPDGNYGAPNEHKVWTGMVQEIITKRADLAVAPLTINYLREQVIDFTKPFMNLGISILFKRPRRESPGLFSFLNPLAIEIWLYVIAAYFLVSLMMFVLARFSPYEWYNPHPCNSDNDVMENMFTLSNSFWFAVGTLMQQGSDINPRAVSTRIVGGIWWFFTLIIISSYTANLAAFLTVERMVSPIESAEDLSKQTKISYGTIDDGSTKIFFKTSKIPTYQRMWAFMENHEDNVFVSTSEEGINRVLKGNYAYLMESTMIDYTIQRNCELMQVGGLLDSKGYGIGTQINSPYRDRISMAILELQENGRIQMLYNKWWKNTGTCNNDEKKQDSKANSLGVANVGGIFVVLFVGLALAVICSIIEFIWNSRKNAAVDRSLWSEMMEELRFAIRCHGSTKKPALKRQCSRCLHHPGEPCAVDSPNGVLQLREMTRYQSSTSPRGRFNDHNSIDGKGSHGHFRYHDPCESYGDYRDSQT